MIIIVIVINIIINCTRTHMKQYSANCPGMFSANSKAIRVLRAEPASH